MNEQLVAKQSKFTVLVARIFLKRPPDVDENSYPAFVVFNIVTTFGTASHIGNLFLFWFLEVNFLALFNVISISMWVLSFYFCRKGSNFLSVAVMVAELLSHQILCVIFIGWGAGFQYFILLIPIGLFMLPAGRNYPKIFILFISLFTFIFLDYFFRNAEPLFSLNPIVLNILNYGNISAVIIIEALGMFYFSSKMKEIESALRKEHDKSESLLLNILPKTIAERLKLDSEIIADRFENVSILFMDIVRFTNMSDKVPAHKVVTFLNELFRVFDGLTEKYSLEKIKTIGDAYMVAAGIPDPCNDHADKIQVSEATYHLLKDKFNFIDRGIINVKGKGNIQTYFLSE